MSFFRYIFTIKYQMKASSAMVFRTGDLAGRQKLNDQIGMILCVEKIQDLLGDHEFFIHFYRNLVECGRVRIIGTKNQS